MSMMGPIRPAGDTDLAAINAVAVTITDLEANVPGSPAALRRGALDRWQAAHDPGHLLERTHLLDAAALARMVESGDGPAFEEHFGELVAFIAELPW